MVGWVCGRVVGWLGCWVIGWVNVGVGVGVGVSKGVGVYEGALCGFAVCGSPVRGGRNGGAVCGRCSGVLGVQAAVGHCLYVGGCEQRAGWCRQQAARGCRQAGCRKAESVAGGWAMERMPVGRVPLSGLSVCCATGAELALGIATSWVHEPSATLRAVGYFVL